MAVLPPGRARPSPAPPRALRALSGLVSWISIPLLPRVVGLDEVEELAPGARTGDQVGAQRHRLLRSHRIDQVGVAHLLDLVAADRPADGVRVDAVCLGGVAAADPVAVAALGLGPAAPRPAGDVRMPGRRVAAPA